MQAPAAFAAVPFLTGAVAGLLIWPLLPEILTAGPGGAAIALVAAAACVADAQPRAACLAIAAGHLLAGGSLGWVAAADAYSPALLGWHAARLSSEPAAIEGVLREDARLGPNGISLLVSVERVDGLPTAGGVRLSVAGTLASPVAGGWRGGRRIRAPALLRRPSAYATPGVPDETRALARRGICLVGTIKSAALVELVAGGSVLDESAGRVREWARSRLTAAVGRYGDRSAAVTTAILVGDRTQLPQADERRLQYAGTYHVIAISGGNIAILTMLLVVAGRAVGLRSPAAAAVAILLLLFYMRLTGAAPSVARAVAAAVVFLSARVFDHRGPPLNAVAVAALIGVAWTPEGVSDPGFILSFGATLAILLGTPLLLPTHHSRRGAAVARLRQWIAGSSAAVLGATVCAELALGPVAASLFGRVTFAGLILNFAAIPLMTVVQIAGLCALAFFDLWPAASDVCARIAHLAATGLVESARLVELAPWLSVRVSPPAWPLVIAYYVSIFLLLSPRHRSRAWFFAAAFALLIIGGPHGIGRDDVQPPRMGLRVAVLDVGQGDATLIAAGRHALLVDAGGTAAFSSSNDESASSGFDVGERVVVPALRALGVFRLDGLVLTHGDPDHILGAPAVIGALQPRSVWEGVPVPRHAPLQLLRAAAADTGATWRTVQAGDRDAFGGVDIRVLHPPPPDWERQRVRNEDSIVLEVRLGIVSIVLAGDIGREGERAIVPRLEPGRLTILKAGHHGSATSSTAEFLDTLRPAVVIFSAGRDNRFGHPHPDVVRRFEAMGTAIFRTDRDGTVMVETDGRVVSVESYTGGTMLLAPHTKTRRHEDTTGATQ